MATQGLGQSRRQLIVMRHAKAGELPGGPDIERALRPRGRKNAESAGEWMAGQGLRPELVLCSKARRARQTWQYVSAGLSGAGLSGTGPSGAGLSGTGPSGTGLGGRTEVVTDERLYGASAADLLRIFSEVDDGVRSLMYVGHNPSAAEVTEILTAGLVEFPTSAIAVIGLNVGWLDLAGDPGGSGDLISSWTPHAHG